MMSSLADIRTKVRRLTGKLSPQQITDAQIDDYVNTFYLYDMPETLRLFTQSTVFEFMTQANVDQYDMNTMQVWDGIQYQNAVDVYITVSPPLYIAGYQSFWSQSREQFFRTYPALAQLVTQVYGDGTPGPYTTTFPNTPILQHQVTVGAVDVNDNVINCIDSPQNSQTGIWNIINDVTIVNGSIDYINGAATVTFNTNIPAGNQVTFTAVPYQPNRPQAMLYYQNICTLRPVPDRSYLIQMNAYKRPTALIDSGEAPQLQQWWQYLAFGCAKKIFEDTQDVVGLNFIMPLFKEQENLALRRTIVQRTNQRTATIYTEMTQFPYGNFQNQF